MRKMLSLGLLLILWAGTLAAAPVPYAIEAAKSSVGFETDFGPDKINGAMPVTRADLVLDFGNVANCTIAVTLNIAGATASFPFATQALKGPKVLDSAAFPDITFVSTAVRAKGDGAEVDGKLTIRGVTRLVTLAAQIYRQDGFDEGDLSHLSVLLTGAVNRSDYGATGWADMVGDEVRLRILARIAAVK
jgi:polyisoprenoid-binding protein YceI